MILCLTWSPILKLIGPSFQKKRSVKSITPLVNQLENINIAECLDSNDSAETITNLLLQNSVSLAKKNFKTNKNNKSFVRLPEEVKVARYHGKVVLDGWKQLNFPLEGDAHDIYHAKREDYRSKLRDFLNHLEVDKIKIFVMLLIVMRSYFENF